MKSKVIRTVICIIILISISAPSFADDSSTTIEPYTKNEFPSWAHDIRRTEIITFGSLPFVTLWVTVAYSAIANGEFHNPLDKSGSSYSTTDQKNIMMIAAASSISLGLTDLTINLIQRGIRGAHDKKLRKPDVITIIPYGQQPGAPAADSAKDSKNEPQPPAPEIPTDYLQGGIESAIF